VLDGVNVVYLVSNTTEWLA